MLGHEEDATCHDGEGKDLEEDTEEATNFKVETQATFLKNTLSFHKQGTDWLSFQEIDCAPVNIKTGKILGIPSIDCSCHNMHNQVVTMINSNPDVKNTLSKAKKAMVGMKNSAKNSTILRN